MSARFSPASRLSLVFRVNDSSNTGKKYSKGCSNKTYKLTPEFHITKEIGIADDDVRQEPLSCDVDDKGIFVRFCKIISVLGIAWSCSFSVSLTLTYNVCTCFLEHIGVPSKKPTRSEFNLFRHININLDIFTYI